MTVGFRHGTFKDGSVTLSSPEGCPNVSQPMVALALRFRDFLKASPLPCLNRTEASGTPIPRPMCILPVALPLSSSRVCSPCVNVDGVADVLADLHAGFWYGLTIRSTARGDHMMVVVVVPIGVSEDVKSAELQRLCAAFPMGPIHLPTPEAPTGTAPLSGVLSGGDGAGVGGSSELADASGGGSGVGGSASGAESSPGPSLVSLYVHENPRYSAPGSDSTCVLLAGQRTIEETMCGMRFLVSPQSFFQVRSSVAVHPVPPYVFVCRPLFILLLGSGSCAPHVHRACCVCR